MISHRVRLAHIFCVGSGLLKHLIWKRRYATPQRKVASEVVVTEPKEENTPGKTVKKLSQTEIDIKTTYQDLVKLESLGEIFKHGNLVAAAYLSVAWLGTMGCVFYFWYVAVLVLSDQTLPAGTVNKLLMVFILLITWFPTRVYMDWYQNYFHNPTWLKDSHGLKMASYLALASLVFVIFISKPEVILIVCAVVNALVLLLVGVAGRFKPHWLRGIAESLQSLPFFYFVGVYFVFLFVTVAIGIRVLHK